MATLHRLTSPLTAENRVKLNENWDIIEGLLSSFRKQLQFISGQDDIEAIMNRLNTTMDDVNVLQTRFTESLNLLETESERIRTESETNLHNQIDELARQAQERLANEVTALQQQIVSSIETLQANIADSENLREQTREQLDQLNTTVSEMETRVASAIESTNTTVAEYETRIAAAITESENRVSAAIESANTAVGDMETRTAATIESANTAMNDIEERVTTSLTNVDEQTTRLYEMRWKGIWETGTDYKTGNIVLYEGRPYIAIGDTSTTKPVGDVNSAAYWTLFAEKGQDGAGVDKVGTSLELMGAAGDGSDVRQIMINALGRANETIFVPKGTYTLKEVLIRRNTRIVGFGWDSVLKLPTDLTTTIRGIVDGVEGLSNTMFGITEPVHVTFENLTFDGDFFNQTEPYNGGCFLRIFKPTLETDKKIVVTFKNCQFINNNHTAIGVYGSGRSDYIFVNVHDCYFAGGAKGTTQTAIPDKWAQGFAPHYISCYDNVTLTIVGNKFIDDILPDNVTTFGRVAINATVTDTTSIENSDKLSTSMFVSNNVFKNLGRNATAPNGLGVIDLYVNGENAVITGNKFINSQMQSIRGKVNVKNLVVTNNIIQNGVDGAIGFHPNNYASKKGNTVIANNIVENTKGYGILLNGDSGTDTNPYFENAVVSGNVVNGITVVPYRTDLANGIYLKKVRNVTVANNEFLNIQYDGVYAEAVNGLTLSNNVIQTTTSTANLGRGVYGKLLLGSLSIENNLIRANTVGVYVTFLFDNATNLIRTLRMVNNHFAEVRNITSQAVYVADFTTAIVAHNILDGLAAATGSTAYGFNFKGALLNLLGNMYIDITGANNDPMGTQAIKLKANVSILKEFNNSWQ